MQEFSTKQNKQHQNNKNSNNQKQHNTFNGYIFIPYVQGLCKSIKAICSKYGINTYVRGNRTIKNIPVAPKDKDPLHCKSVSCTGTDAIGLVVIRSTLENPQEDLGQDIRNA